MITMDASSVYNDACRLCDEKKEPMHSIFSKNKQGKQILQLIKECLPVIIYRTDPLPKQICDECFTKLETFYYFKQTSLATATRHKRHLLNTASNSNKRIQLYLSCEDAEMPDILPNNIPQRSSKGTSTNDLTISCINCKSTCFDSTIINSEVELCAELHKAIADSLSNNKVMVTQDGEKLGRSRRRRSQAFYHELDDSLCSSLTEFTNTESSQCYDEDHSEVESYETDSEDAQKAKRRKLNDSLILNGEDPAKQGEKILQQVQVVKELYSNEIEHRYFPLSLMNLALNVVNKRIVPDHQPDDFYEKVIEPQCTYCKRKLKNSKLLALHETEHINIELGEKVDNPSLWHESRDDSHVRNKWLNSYDEIECEEESELLEEEELEPPPVIESLLIPVGTEVPQEHKVAGEIVLVMAKPTVNGLALAEYSKEERKTFYKTMKIGGVNKKFCSLCRYSFKDNWAIESHYFSLACYYTCRYCGMRFNKQRHRFDEHVKEHEERSDPLSTKIYAASKLNNFVPRIIQPDKVKKIVAQHDQDKMPTIKVKNFQRKTLQSSIKIKEEKMDSDEEKASPSFQKTTTTAKTTNQAYFCRKCYKVFFKLDEFNIHSKNCDYNQFPQNRNSVVNNKFPNKMSSNGEMVSPTGRPMRHCVRETNTYKDETVTPENNAAKEPTPQQNQQSFVCFICNTPFPTIYSRNSHMRIHKGENKTPPIQRPQRQIYNNSSEKVQNFPGFIKQEPLEPEIQIHEEQNYSSNSIGTVSITPISKNPNQKATINPNIMKLVQNNPHLTIKANRSPDRQPAPGASNMQNSMSDADKSYKCSSCWEAFSNKSHLYFHKKNQCEGSKYPCPFCKKRFGTEAAYSSHIFYSHPE